MDYNLAKQLKDAEFHGGTGSLAIPGNEVIWLAPTLSELIEACGDKLESIIQRGAGEGDNWEVRSKHERFNATTLIEAVAKLWLELNKK